MTTHYDEQYFEWQRRIGEFGGQAELFKFAKSLDELRLDSRVLDFGCGGGFLLSELFQNHKYGVEINDTAASLAKDKGLEVFSTVESYLKIYGESSVDLVISNHALEHTSNPTQEIISLYKCLKPGGVVHIFVPCDSYDLPYDPGDINQHLFSWSPMNLGNLLSFGGFELIVARPYLHKWPPKYLEIQRYLGWTGFNIASRVFARISRGWFQVEAIARKPLDGGC